MNFKEVSNEKHPRETDRKREAISYLLELKFNRINENKTHQASKQCHHRVQCFLAAAGGYQMTLLIYSELAAQQFHVPLNPTKMVEIKPRQQYISLFQLLSPE